MSGNEQISNLEKILKDSLQTISAKIDTTNEKIENVQKSIPGEIQRIDDTLNTHNVRLNTIENKLTDNSTEQQIQSLQFQLERIKQAHISNNIRFTGLPHEILASPINAFIKIAETLNVNLLPSDFMAHSDRNKSSLIVHFCNQMYKRQILDALRTRKVLLVEEVFPDTISNAKIYANDQLTPYFANLFQIAWNAKRNGQLYSASSAGGHIKVKKVENGPPITIENENQLRSIIDSTDDNAPTRAHDDGENASEAKSNNEKPATDTRNENEKQSHNNSNNNNKSNSFSNNNNRHRGNNNNNYNDKFAQYTSRLNHHGNQHNNNKRQQQQQHQHQQRRDSNRRTNQDQYRFNHSHNNQRANGYHSRDQEFLNEGRFLDNDQPPAAFGNHNNNNNYQNNDRQSNYNGGRYQRTNGQFNYRNGWKCSCDYSSNGFHSLIIIIQYFITQYFSHFYNLVIFFLLPFSTHLFLDIKK